MIDFFMPAFREGFGGVTIIRNDIPDANPKPRPKLYAIHPHALLANGLGIAMNDCISRNERVTVLASSILYWLNPLFHLFVNAMGCGFSTVMKYDIERLMRDRESIALVPGGFEEVMLMEPGSDVLFIKHRQGFLRLCNKFDYDVVPVFTFGESLLYRNRISLTRSLKILSARIKIPLALPVGDSCWTFMPSPLPRGMLIVFGKRIASNGDVDGLHKKYLENLKDMHDRYNLYPSIRLTIH